MIGSDGRIIWKNVRELFKYFKENEHNSIKKEYKIRRFFRRTIVSRRLIKKGVKINFDDFNFQRTNEKGKRLNPKDYFKIIGKKTKRNILPNKIISKNLLK